MRYLFMFAVFVSVQWASFKNWRIEFDKISNATSGKFCLLHEIICKIVHRRGQNKNDKTCKSVKVTRPGM